MVKDTTRRLDFELMITGDDDFTYVKKVIDILFGDHLIGGYTIKEIVDDDQEEPDLVELVR
jgi:hypothetical protein